MNNQKRGCIATILSWFGINMAPKQPSSEFVPPSQTIQQNVSVNHNSLLPLNSKAPPTDTDILPYQLANNFLTHTELKLYFVLQTIARNRWIICPKVGLKDVFYVKNKLNNMASFYKIAQKHVDFLLCDIKTLRPLLGIELDGEDHRRWDRAEVDLFKSSVFESARLPLLRIQVRSSYDHQALDSLIEQKITGKTILDSSHEEHPNVNEKIIPLCPNCDLLMILKTARKGINAGKHFYSCPNFPRCRQKYHYYAYCMT